MAMGRKRAFRLSGSSARPAYLPPPHIRVSDVGEAGRQAQREREREKQPDMKTYRERDGESRDAPRVHGDENSVGGVERNVGALEHEPGHPCTGGGRIG